MDGSWVAATVRYADMAARHELLTHVVPVAAAEAEVRRWFFADLNPGSGGMVEICGQTLPSVEREQLDRLSRSIGTRAPTGTQLTVRRPPTASVLDPVLFGGRPPPDAYVSVHCVAATRAVSWMRQSRRDADNREITAEWLEMMTALSEDVDRALQIYVHWLEAVGRRANPDTSPRRPTTVAALAESRVPIRLRGSPDYEVVAAELMSSSAGVPLISMVGRLVHTQLLRIAPLLTLAEEIELFSQQG